MLDIKILEASLCQAVDEFRQNAQSYFDTKGNSDLDELAKYTFYALNDFKTAILEYLESLG